MSNTVAPKDDKVEDLFKRHTLDSKETWKKTNKNLKIFSSKPLFPQHDENSSLNISHQTPYYSAYMRDL